MRILHTSDWHLGRTLYGKKRYEEFSSFLKWLIETIKESQVDTLLVSGDIFDTSTPSNRSQQLYYQFLSEVSHTCCHHIVITAGNHDSPTFLDAPKEILKALNVEVIGTSRERPEDEVLSLYDTDGNPSAIICAVPYLRDRDLRSAVIGESVEDKDSKLIQGLKSHYEAVCSYGETLQREYQEEGYDKIPIIAMGHLFAAGGKTSEGDGVRELYVGSLAHFGADSFPSSIDYLALGHLHIAQRIGGVDTMRYCGSPIPVGFGEAKHQKLVLLVEFKASQVEVHEIQVPCFQRLLQIRGDLSEIKRRLEALICEHSSIWLEIDYSGDEIIHDLKGELESLIEGSDLEILRLRNQKIIERVLSSTEEHESLADLDEYQVFTRFMDDHEIPEDMRVGLLEAYKEILITIDEQDTKEQ